MTALFRTTVALGFVVALAACATVLLNGRTSASSAVGDVNCDGHVGSIDAALILQQSAGLIESVSCAQKADVDGDARVDAVDASFILQYVAGLIPSAGTPYPTPSATKTPMPTKTPCPDGRCPTVTPTPSPIRVPGGPQFSISADIDGDGKPDCTSSGDFVDSWCYFNEFPEPAPWRTLFVRLDALPDGVSSYDGFSVALDYNKSVVFPCCVDTHWWPDCALPNASPYDLGCTIGEPPAPPSTYLGVVGTLQFPTSCDFKLGQITLQYSYTYLVSGDQTYHEAVSGKETLTFSCIFDGGLPPGCLFGRCLTTPAPLP